MKVKIKKDDKIKSYQVNKSWSEVTLEKWLSIVSLEEAGASEEALSTLKQLSNIPDDLIKQLSISDVATIMDRVSILQQKANGALKRIIKVDGKEYGFHPSLDRITLGEYADLETFIMLVIQKHLPEIMAILYRPIVEKKNKIYTIEKYDGDIDIRTEVMKKMKAEQVQSALVFFWTLGKELSRIIPSYLMEALNKKAESMQVNPLQKNGDGSE